MLAIVVKIAVNVLISIAALAFVYKHAWLRRAEEVSIFLLEELAKKGRLTREEQDAMEAIWKDIKWGR